MAKRGSRVSTIGAKESDKSTHNKYSKQLKEGDFTINEGSEKEQDNKVLKFWFLLDKDVVQAIANGNYRLVGMAIAMIYFLLKVVDLDLLNKGLKGEEEAMMGINEFLRNNGRWVKADNLNIRELGMNSVASNERDGQLDESPMSFI